MDTIHKSGKHLAKWYLIIKTLELASFNAIASTYVLFLLERGLTPEQTTQVNIVFMVTNFFFDLPTGALADLVGQLPVYLVGTLILTVGFGLYGTGTTFAFFAFCEGSSAVGKSLMSEALEALMTNKLGVDTAKQIKSKEGVYARLGAIPWALVGAYLGNKYGMQTPWYLGAGTVFVAFVLGYITLRRYHEKPVNNAACKTDHIKNLGNQIRTGLSLVRQNNDRKFGVTMLCFFALVTQTLNMFWAPVLQEQAGSTWWLGLFWIGIAITTAFGAYLGRKLKATKRTFGLVILSVGLPILLINMLPQNALITAVMFLLHEIGRGIIPILTFPLINRSLPDEQRSATNSAVGSLERLSRATGLYVFGALSNHMTLINTWWISGVLLFGLGTWLLVKRNE